MQIICKTKIDMQAESGGTRPGTVKALEDDTSHRSQSYIVTHVPRSLKSLTLTVLKVGGTSVRKGTPVAMIEGRVFLKSIFLVLVQ